MVVQLTAWGYSYNEICRHTQSFKAQLWKMRNDPSYEPKYTHGRKFRLYYARMRIRQRSKSM